MLPDYFEKDNIKLPLTRGHASVVERAIRTIKDMVYKRLEHNEEKGKKVDWSDCLFEVVLTPDIQQYNGSFCDQDDTI